VAEWMDSVGQPVRREPGRKGGGRTEERKKGMTAELELIKEVWYQNRKDMLET